MVCILHGYYDAHPRMRFSLSPPPPKVTAAVTSPSGASSVHTSSTFDFSAYQVSADSGYGGYDGCSGNRTDGMSAATANAMTDDVTSDYSQWLHAMKLVARLPGGMPPEFRRKLWLSLADKYLKSKNVDWSKAEEKCFCEKWREDDEELGVQIVKDLHRTGSNICTGPAGSINQAKLKRILLGYARYNPEVGYCQGFNMLGALIMQVMDKEEDESMKVMIYLVEGVLPTGYFCGSMGGLQADMGVFRELMQTTQPRLAKHLQKLQGPVENAFEPPLTNVFTMQWFLTMFCTCLPMTCVLRVWDLVLIEGSDVLLRTALVLWSLLEERVLNSRTADDFYCKMGSFSSELLNGHLIDSNGLIEKVVQLGPIPDIQKLRDKHLYNIAPLRSNQGLQLYFDDEEMESDEESRLAVATVWGIPWGRRGSHGQSTVTKQTTENKDRIALDISLLKKQYDRLRERQKQAHIILTSACSTARQGNTPVANTLNQQSVPVNQLLLGRSAIITNKGKRIGPLPGAIPPARKPSLPTVLQTKPPEKQLRRGETLHWRDTDLSKRRRDSLTWKEIKADRATMLNESVMVVPAQKIRSRIGKSDSSSYSEEDSGDDDDCSSTDTSLCDEDDPNSMGDKTHSKSIESSPKKRSKVSRKLKDVTKRKQTLSASHVSSKERKRPNSWAPSSEIPFILMTSDSPLHNDDEEKYEELNADAPMKDDDSTTECDRLNCIDAKKLDTELAHTSGNLNEFNVCDILSQTIDVKVSAAVSTNQLSPLADISPYLSNATISSLPLSKPLLLASMSSLGSEDGDGNDTKKFDVGDDGVTNEYFERINSVERPTKLELFFSLNEEDSARNASEDIAKDPCGDDSKVDLLISSSNIDAGSEISNDDNLKDNCTQQELPAIITVTNVDRCMELLIDYSEKSSAAFIAQATNELSISLNKEKNTPDLQVVKCLMRDGNIPGEICNEFIEDSPDFRSKRIVEHNMLFSENNIKKNPGHVTLTRSPTVESEKGFELIQKQLSGDVITNDVNDFKTSSEEVHEISVPSNENGRIIPSTADLEKRFNTLERQQSLGAHRHLTVKDDSLNKSECSISKSTDTNTHFKSIRNPIPSTADLESRFDALERQMSTSNAAAITSVDRKDIEGDVDSKSKSNKNSSNESTQNPLHTNESKSDTEIKIIELSSGPSVNRDKQPLKKLPSAAELEDRFNALERKKSLQNITPFQTKKEPPDIKKKQSTNHNEPENANLKIISKQNYTDNSNSSEAESQVIDEKYRKKAPPSTEELEKRFNALEKHMNQQSSPINGPDVKNQSSSLNPPKCHSSLQSTHSASVPSNEKISDKPNNAMESTSQNKLKDSEKKDMVLTKRDNLSMRRASEPPPTEDLGKRYESLKRRMSSKIINEKCMSKSETVEEALERIEKVIIDDISEINERHGIKESSPEKMSKIKHSNFRMDDCEEIAAEEKSAPNELLTELNQKSCGKTNKCQEQNKAELHGSSIPDPPPIPLVIATQARNEKSAINLTTHRALIEELQTQIKVQANDENLKPSDMILSRKRLQLKRTALTGDETSETHADTAFNRSENYEPVQYRIQSSKKMIAVRRFSDLPSRADLENRLYFLETQFSTNIYKQRCAGDSEVASRRHFSGIDRDEDKPTTSLQQESSSQQLERRVQALEKQLSDNSLKLLQALNKKEVEIPNPNEYQQLLSSETIDASGRELVRYANIDDVEGTETHKPINISINIKMLMSKDHQKVKTEIAAACLEKRVEDIEKQLDTSKIKESVNKSQNEALNNNSSQIDITNEANCENENQADVLNVPEATNEISIDINDHKNEEKKQDIEIGNAKMEQIMKNEVIEQLSEKEGETKPEEISADKLSDITENLKHHPSPPKPDEISVDKLSEKTEDLKHHPSPQNTEVEHKKSPKSLNAVVVDQTQPFPTTELDLTSEELAQNSINESVVEHTDPKNKTLVLLLDNEPKSVKVRRLTRANTEELEGLFQALEKQLSDRNLIKSEDGKLTHCDKQEYTESEKPTEESKAIVDLTEQITKLASADAEIKPKESNDFDWGPDPVKRHLKRKTVHLPSTKELESRFRSLERQIKLLEDVENIDVEQRLHEIERKIKLQHSLSHEKDLVKFLELCEEQDLDNNTQISISQGQSKEFESTHNSSARNKRQSRYTSPSRVKAKSPFTSPTRSIIRKSPYTSPSRTNKRCQQSSPHRRIHSDDIIPSTEDLEYRYRTLDISRSKSKESLNKYSRKKPETNNKPIHPLEMLLDPSSDDDDIPTTGELEHRMKVLEENRKQNSHQRKSRSHSPIKRELPTTDELEARVRALEKEQCFDIKMQNNFKEFNQKLKDVVSPSQSFEEFHPSKLLEESPRQCEISRSITPRSASHDLDVDISQCRYRSTSPKMIRFCDNEEYKLKSKVEHRDTERTTLTDSNNVIYGSTTALSEGLDALGTRFMRETSPLQRTGTHTGVPLRTNDNINERLTSIKNTIKSIDSLCEEKPYRKEKCQRYIDSLFSDSVHFAHKKASLENLKKESHILHGYTPSICVSDHTQRPSEYFLSRSTGSVESMHSTSPLRAASPLHHRSNRDLRRDTSPRWRMDEEREEYESRVRRDNILPTYFPYDISKLSRNSLTKFHEVDRQQDTHRYDERERSSSSRSASRSPMRSPYGSRETMMLHNTTANTVTTEHNRRLDLDRPVSPYRQTSHNLLGHDPLKRSNTPIYSPSKLDIRHTTVTSTFYDRLLTEKQIEKTFSRPSSRSPIISPSLTSKSYLDILIPNGSNNSQMSKESSPTTTYMKCIRGATNLQPSVHSKSFGFSNNADSTEKTHTEAVGIVPCATSLNSTIKPIQYSATTPAGNSSTYQTAQLSRLPSGTDDSQTEIRIRSCDNILMEMKSISTTTAGSGSVVTATSSPTAASFVEISATTAPATITSNNPSNYISSLYNTYPNASRFSPILTSLATISPNVTTITPANTTTNTIYSVGFLNSLKPLPLQQPSVISASLTCNTKSLDNNNSPASMPSSSAYRPSS